MTIQPSPARKRLEQQRLAAVERSYKPAQLGFMEAAYFPAVKRAASLAHGKPHADQVRTLYEAIKPLTGAISTLAACKKGCSHCCHIAVTVNDAEAEVIRQATGITPVQPATNHKLDSRDDFAQRLPLGYGNPCPFLKGGECSIYEARPMACRTHFNFDIDNELCKLHDGNTALPMWKSINVDMLLVGAAGGPYSVFVADIREWFPHVKEGAVVVEGDNP